MDTPTRPVSVTCQLCELRRTILILDLTRLRWVLPCPVSSRTTSTRRAASNRGRWRRWNRRGDGNRRPRSRCPGLSNRASCRGARECSGCRLRSASFRRSRLLSSTSIWIHACGFIHSTRVTVPVSVIGWFASNSAENAWCADTGTTAVHAAPASKAETVSRIVPLLINRCFQPRAARPRVLPTTVLASHSSLRGRRIRPIALPADA